MKRTWQGSMTMQQALNLMPTFARYTEGGWTIPNWLDHLILQIYLRDIGR